MIKYFDSLRMLEARAEPRVDDQAPACRLVILRPPGPSRGVRFPRSHSHANGPVVAYLVSGEYTEHRDGMGEIVHQPGEQWVEGADVAHWSENRGSEPTVLINVDIRPTQ